MDKGLQAIVCNKKWIFFSLLAVFTWGMAAHGYAFFDNSLSHDSLREFHAQILGNEIKMGSGRIFTPFYRDLLGSDVTMPWFGGVLALLWIGLSVFLTIQIFDVRSKITVFLIAGIFSTNISISATVATYIHDLDSYMFSLFCAVAAVYLWKQQRYGWIYGSFLIALSLGIYQSFLFVSVTLVMINCIFQLFDEHTFRDVFDQGLCAVVMILLGGALYYLAMKGALWLSDTELVKGDYNSLDLITHLTPATIIRLVGSAYADCFQRLYHAYSSYPAAMVKGITVLFFGICTIGAAFALCNEKLNTAQRSLCLLLILLLPLGMNMIHVLVLSRNHDLMTFPIWLFYLIVLLMSDWLARKCKKKGEHSRMDTTGQWQRWTCFLLVAILLYGNVRFSNGMYMKKDLEYDAYLSLMTRVVGRIEAEEGYVPEETPVVIVGLPEALNTMIPGFKDYWNVTGMLKTDVVYADERSRYQAYFDYVMNTPIKLAEAAQWNEVRQREDIREMPCYPADGFLRFYDNVLIVKLGEIQEMEFV